MSLTRILVATLLLSFTAPFAMAQAELNCDRPGKGAETLESSLAEQLLQWADSLPNVDDRALYCNAGLLRFKATVADAAVLQFSPDLSVLAEPRKFYGLAAYYNSVRNVAVESPQSGATWSGWKGRYTAALVKLQDGSVLVDGSRVELVPGASGRVELQIGLIDAIGQGQFDGISGRDLRYSHLWDWLRWLALLLEDMLLGIQGLTGIGWGASIILLCAAVKVLLIPVSIYVHAQQRKVGMIQTQLHEPLQAIKAKYDGEEAHTRIMAEHKRLGVSPFYALTPVLGMFIQVPVLVAVFNMLGEVPNLSGQPFWWISDLAYPDAILHFGSAGFALPLFGNSLNFLPILMTVVTVAAAVVYKNRVAPAAETRRQKRHLYLMAAAFFVLFYPFPAAMVLYWATANVLQVIQQLVTEK